jgi:hypothetical protein
MRKSHRWAAMLIAFPFLLVIATGILLQLKKEWSWVQPPSQRGQGKTPAISLQAMLEAARSRPEVGVQTWDDVERLDVQPGRGIAKVQARSRWEVQVDLTTGEVLQSAFRRSDLIESLHDGSWFHESVKLWVFLPVAMVVLGLWATGTYLFFLPYAVRWSRRRHDMKHPMRATLLILILAAPAAGQADEMPSIRISKNGKAFVLEPSGQAFTPWGFNYDHDPDGRLIEDYWDTEWDKVAAHFGQMKKLGANVVRIHLQLGKFMEAADRPRANALDRLAKLLSLAEKTGLYIDLTGLGCYHKADVPAWYDRLSEKDRWDVQARFWEAVAGRCANSPAIFCYDLMNEPVVAGGKRKDGDWLGPAFGGKHFVQFITLDAQNRPRHEIARQWLKHLVAAVRKQDKRHLITVGLVDWSLERPGLTSGFVPSRIADDLDFLCVHLYPAKDKVGEALKTLSGFNVGKPVVIEETFPLRCSLEEFRSFVEGSKKHAVGWIGFYWGKPPEELRKGRTISDAIMLGWLEYFQKVAGPR